MSLAGDSDTYRNMSTVTLAIARVFASSLDADDFPALTELLSATCEYLIRDKTLRGPEAIGQSYREASDWAKGHIDSVVFESSVRQESEQVAIVTFVDHLQHQGHGHTFRCEQRVFVGEDGKISRIVHQDLPGEREAADAFLARIGVSR
jgi:hypothetical protein